MKVGDLVRIKGSALEWIIGSDEGDVGIVIAIKARGGRVPYVETTVAWNGDGGTGRYWSSDLEVISESR
jgi:hypothetical protein